MCDELLHVRTDFLERERVTWSAFRRDRVRPALQAEANTLNRPPRLYSVERGPFSMDTMLI